MYWRLTCSVLMVSAWVAVAAAGYGQPSDQGGATPPIRGLSTDAAESIRGVEKLFELPNASETPRVVPGRSYRRSEVVARFLLNFDDDDVQHIARQAGARRVTRISPLGLFVLQGPDNDRAVEGLMKQLANSGSTVLVTPNYIGEGGLAFSPNDPHATSSAQWYLDAPSGIDLDLSEAWNITRGSSDVVVGVMDSGLDPLHPEFIGRLWFNPGEIAGNGIDDDGNGYVDDRNGWDTTSPGGGDSNIRDDDGGPQGIGVGHGTWVSSILLANTDNDHQVAGFDHFAKVLSVRAFDTGTGYELAEVLAGLDYLLITSEHYDLLNMSWVASVNDQGLETSLDALEQAGALMIAGAGNGGGSSEIWYPAAHPWAITVGGTDDTDTLWAFSDTGNNLDFVAPAVDIYTASFSNSQSATAFHIGPGTSFATPMVTGIASLALSIRSALSRDDLVYALRNSAVDLGSPGWDRSHGWGRVNANDALQTLEALIFFEDFESGDLSRWSSSTP